MSWPPRCPHHKTPYDIDDVLRGYVCPHCEAELNAHTVASWHRFRRWLRLRFGH